MYESGYAWESENRYFSCYLYMYDSTQNKFVNTFDEEIASVNIDESLISTSSLTFGNTCAGQLTVSLRDVSPANKLKLTRGSQIEVRLNVYDRDSVYGTKRVTCGLYYIDEIESTETRKTESDSHYCDITLKCYDAYYLSDREYVPTLTIDSEHPQSLTNMALDVVKSMGLYDTNAPTKYISGFSSSITVTSYPEQSSCREMLGYLAGRQGTNCVVTVGGTVASPYPVFTALMFNDCTTKTIAQDEQFLDEYSVTGDTVSISRIESGTQNNIYVYPTDGTIAHSISYECPYITEQSQVQAIQQAVVSFANTMQGGSALVFTPMKVHWKGNAQIKVGDFVKVEDKDGNLNYCCVMAKSLNYDGGLSETYECLSEAEKSVSFVLNPQMRTIDRKLSVMEEAIMEATETIGDVEAMQDGVFSIIPNQQGTANVGWKIESNVNNHYILANINGIGFSSNGGSSFNSAAIYIDSNGNGQINGNFITANTVTVDKLSFTSGATYSNLDNYVEGRISAGGIVIGESSITGLTSDLQDLSDAASGAVSTANDALDDVTALQKSKARYLTSSSSATTATKICKLPDNNDFTISTGTTITVKFDYTAYYTTTEYSISLTIQKNNGTNVLSNKAVYYNGTRLTSKSVSAWSANGLVSFLYDGTNWVMQDNVANTILSDWCMANNRTYIDGSNIYTGTLEASAIYTGIIGKRTQATGTLTASTYFDLDNNKLVCVANGYYRTVLTGGELQIDIDTNGNSNFTTYGGISSYYNAYGAKAIINRFTTSAQWVVGSGPANNIDPYFSCSTSSINGFGDGIIFHKRAYFLAPSGSYPPTVIATNSGVEPRLLLQNTADGTGVLITFNPTNKTLWFTGFSNDGSTTEWTHYMNSSGVA